MSDDGRQIVDLEAQIAALQESDGGPILAATVTLSPADIVALGSSPIHFLDGPGEGKALVFPHPTAFLAYTPGAVPYTLNPDMSVANRAGEVLIGFDGQAEGDLVNEFDPYWFTMRGVIDGLTPKVSYGAYESNAYNLLSDTPAAFDRSDIENSGLSIYWAAGGDDIDPPVRYGQHPPTDGDGTVALTVYYIVLTLP